MGDYNNDGFPDLFVTGFGRSLLYRNNGDGSYLSSSDPRGILGLGAAPQLDWIEIRWPGLSSRVDRFTGLPVDRYITIVEGQGITP